MTKRYVYYFDSAVIYSSMLSKVALDRKLFLQNKYNLLVCCCFL